MVALNDYFEPSEYNQTQIIINMASKNNYHLFSSLLGSVLNISIFSTAFYDIGFINSLCGPLTIPPQQELFTNVVVFCLFSSHYAAGGLIYRFIRSNSRCLNNLRIKTLLNSYCVKYLVLLMLKLPIIFAQSHRLKYYLVVFLLELFTIALGVAMDFLDRRNMSEVIDVVFMDLIGKTTVLYELNRTFCPSFGLYWFISNLLVLLVSQIQSHFKNRNPDFYTPLFSSALYVKQDAQRFIAFVGVYFGVFSLAQIDLYGYGMFVIFLCSVIPFYMGVRFMDQNKLALSTVCLFSVGIAVMVLIMTRNGSPHLFRPLYGEDFEQARDSADPVEPFQFLQFCRQEVKG